MDWLKNLTSNHTFLFFFAVVGIPMIVMGLKEIIKLLIKHRERMAMIEHGMHPDSPNRALRRVERTPAETVAASDLSK
jgi:hypothetical protein